MPKIFLISVFDSCRRCTLRLLF